MIMDVPCARKNVIAPKICMKINHGTRMSMLASGRLRDAIII
jgi:hypothetical protein